MKLIKWLQQFGDARRRYVATSSVVPKFNPRFVAGPKLEFESPRPPNPPVLGYGDSCFKAECFLYDAVGTASFRGYDKTMKIVEDVENACKLQSNGKAGTVCTPATLTFLPSTKLECSGQVYFTYDSDSSSGSLLKKPDTM